MKKTLRSLKAHSLAQLLSPNIQSLILLPKEKTKSSTPSKKI
jgi:hypothetical protein